MNISKENIDSLNAVLKVELSEADYQERVKTVLDNYRKTADMPGFRKGKVPLGIIKKRFGISVKVEEINKLISDSLTKYIVDEKLDILGNPLPKENVQIDWEKQDNFVFEYELGLSPSFELKISKKHKIDYYTIKADAIMIDRYAEDISKRYGKMTSPNTVQEKDLVYGTFNELDAKQTKVEGGLTNQASISLDALKLKKLKNEFIGSKKGAVILLDPKKAFVNDTDAAAMLNIDKKAYAELKATFSFTIENISRMQPAELNTELFDKLYGVGVIKNEKEFRSKIAAEAELVFIGDADRKFQNDAVDFLLNTTSFDLPEAFLKRWMQSVSEKPVTLEEIEQNFEGYKKSLKWQIIENKIAKEHKLSVTKEQAVEETKKLIRTQMAQYGQLSPKEEELEKYALQVLSNKEEEKNIYDRVFAAKLTDFFKSAFIMNEKEISYKNFQKLTQG